MTIPAEVLEQQNQNQNQPNQDSQQQIPQENNQPTNNGNVVTPQILEFYADQARAAREEAMRLQNELNQQRTQQAPPRTYDNLNPDFLERPATNIAEIVRHEVQNTIKPIQDEFTSFMRQQQYTTAYANLKNQIRNIVPNFNIVESRVDQLMNGVEPNITNIQAAVRMAFGELAMAGQLPNMNQNQNQNQNFNQNNNSRTVPAQIPPSAPPMPNNDSRIPARPTLTEYENRLAREKGMTPEEYIYWRDLPPNMVAQSKGWDRVNNKPAE